MMGGSPQGKTTQSTNKSKREQYHEQANSPREEEKEGTPEATKGDHHSLASDDSLSPWRKRQRNDDSLQGGFQKIRAPTYEVWKLNPGVRKITLTKIANYTWKLHTKEIEYGAEH